MEDIAIYTAYYSHYHVRAAEAAAAVRSVPRKSSGVACAFLAFGAACGMATVAVGFVAHNPAVIWPVVAMGIIGVIGGLVLAHRQATGGWVWGASPASSPAPSQRGSAGQAVAVAGAAAGGLPGGLQLPMYYADALDVEMGFGQLLPSPSAATAEAGCAAFACGDADGCRRCCGVGSDGVGSSGSSEGYSATVLKAESPVAAVPAAAAAAAEYGTVMCGFPLPGADGWIDTRPVLVLQPHSHLLHHSDARVRSGSWVGGTAEAAEAAASAPSWTSSSATAAAAAAAHWAPVESQDPSCGEPAPHPLVGDRTPERSGAPAPLPPSASPAQEGL